MIRYAEIDREYGLMPAPGLSPKWPWILTKWGERRHRARLDAAMVAADEWLRVMGARGADGVGA